MDKNTQQSPHWLVVVRDISAIIAAIIIPVTLAVSGNHINSTIKEKEIRLQYVEIAVDILKSKPTDETKALRDWSILVIQEYSAIPFSTNAIYELQSQPLPNASPLIDADGNKVFDRDGKQRYMRN